MVKNGFAENRPGHFSISPSIIYEELFTRKMVLPRIWYSSNNSCPLNDLKQNRSFSNSKKKSKPGTCSIGIHFVSIRLSAVMGDDAACCGAETHDSHKLNIPTDKRKNNILIRIKSLRLKQLCEIVDIVIPDGLLERI